jgi:hypothetical protein
MVNLQPNSFYFYLDGLTVSSTLFCSFLGFNSLMFSGLQSNRQNRQTVMCFFVRYLSDWCFLLVAPYNEGMCIV